jgi:hypothetical protein
MIQLKLCVGLIYKSIRNNTEKMGMETRAEKGWGHANNC